ncbi:MAG: phosphatidate cytidylyltransferase [Hyphomicrobiaceae bacterium]
MSEPAIRHVPFPMREVGLRVLSGVVLAAATLGLTWSGPVPFAFLVGAIALVLIWEWGRVTSGVGFTTARVLAGFGVLVAIGMTVSGRPGLGLIGVAAGALAATVLGGLPNRVSELGGALYAGLPAVSLVWLRADAGHGLEIIVLLLLIVWATDTGAFVAGRAIGGPRLWERVSPKKTWAGLGGGVVAAAIVAWLYTRVLGGTAVGHPIMLGAVLAVVSQVGDLFESALKRAHGVKDSSSLIPGHGGFMDRVDGLVFAAVAAAAYAYALAPGAPAELLLGLR